MIDSVSKRYNECGIRIGAIVTRNKSVRAAVMKFCQARLSPPLIGQIVAEASIDTPEEYMRATFNEYVERRNFLIERINEIPGCFTPMPMGAFYTVARLPPSTTPTLSVAGASRNSSTRGRQYSWPPRPLLQRARNG